MHPLTSQSAPTVRTRRLLFYLSWIPCYGPPTRIQVPLSALHGREAAPSRGTTIMRLDLRMVHRPAGGRGSRPVSAKTCPIQPGRRPRHDGDVSFLGASCQKSIGIGRREASGVRLDTSQQVEMNCLSPRQARHACPRKMLQPRRHPPWCPIPGSVTSQTRLDPH